MDNPWDDLAEDENGMAKELCTHNSRNKTSSSRSSPKVMTALRLWLWIVGVLDGLVTELMRTNGQGEIIAAVRVYVLVRLVSGTREQVFVLV